MSETSTTAMLVGTRELFGTRSNVLATTVPRSQIEDALALDPPADLILDVVRRSEGKDDLERRTVNVAWTRKDLESLLDDTDAPALTFSFDADELERAIAGSDVEGHGLRETAAVLTIAAAAAAWGASGALGAVHDEASLAERGIAVEASTAVHTEAGLTERGIGIQAVSHDEMTNVARGIDAGTPPAVHDESTLAARGIEPGTLPAIHDESTLADRGIEPGTLPAIHDESTLADRGIEPGTLPAIHDESTLADRGIEPGTIPVQDTATPLIHDESTLADRGIEPGTIPVAATGGESGFDFPSVDSGALAGIAGGLAGAGLLIAAAAFATRRREPGTV
jgi:hypothetical protein